MILAVFVFIFHCACGIISDALGKKRLASQAYVDKLIDGNISNTEKHVNKTITDKIKSDDCVGLLDLEIDGNNRIVSAIGAYNWYYLNWFMDKNKISEVYIKGRMKSTGYVYDTIQKKNYILEGTCDIFNISDNTCSQIDGSLYFVDPIKGDTGEDTTWIGNQDGSYDGKLYTFCDLSLDDPKYSDSCTQAGESEIILERFALVLPDKRRMGDSELKKYAASLKYVKEKISDVDKNIDIRIKDRIKDDVYKKYEDLEIDGNNRIVRAIGRDGYLELAKYMYDNNVEIHVKGYKKASGKKIDIRYPRITTGNNITMLIGYPGNPDTEWAEFTVFAENKEYSGKLLAYCDLPATCDSSDDEVILEKFRLIYSAARQLDEEEMSKYAPSLKYVDKYRLNDDLKYINKEKKEIRKLPIEEKELIVDNRVLTKFENSVDSYYYSLKECEANIKVHSVPFHEGAHLVGKCKTEVFVDDSNSNANFDIIFKTEEIYSASETGICTEGGNWHYMFVTDREGLEPNDEADFLNLYWNDKTGIIVERIRFHPSHSSSSSPKSYTDFIFVNVTLAEAELPVVDRLALLSEIPEASELSGIVVNSESQAEDKAYSASFVEKNFAKKPAEDKPFLTTANISPDDGEAVTPSTVLPTPQKAKKLAKEWFDGEYEIVE